MRNTHKSSKLPFNFFLLRGLVREENLEIEIPLETHPEALSSATLRSIIQQMI